MGKDSAEELLPWPMPKFLARFSNKGLTTFFDSTLALSGAAAIFFLPFFATPLAVLPVDEDVFDVDALVTVVVFFVVELPVAGGMVTIENDLNIQSKTKDAKIRPRFILYHLTIDCAYLNN